MRQPRGSAIVSALDLIKLSNAMKDGRIVHAPNRIAIAYEIILFDSIRIGAGNADAVDSIGLIGRFGGMEVFARYVCPWQAALRGERIVRSFRLHEVVWTPEGRLALKLPPPGWAVSADAVARIPPFRSVGCNASRLHRLRH